jgi:hypothetical protein
MGLLTDQYFTLAIESASISWRKSSYRLNSLQGVDQRSKPFFKLIANKICPQP